jgi:hypothetical protein
MIIVSSVGHRINGDPLMLDELAFANFLIVITLSLIFRY